MMIILCHSFYNLFSQLFICRRLSTENSLKLDSRLVPNLFRGKDQGHHHQQHHQDSSLAGNDGSYTTANLQAMEAVVDIPLSSGMYKANLLIRRLNHELILNFILSILQIRGRSAITPTIVAEKRVERLVTTFCSHSAESCPLHNGSIYSTLCIK